MGKHMPGPWKVGYNAMDVVAPSLKGGDAKVCDIRGWGYLTGKGHGALGMSEAEAIAIQEANARLIAAAPEMLEALKLAYATLTGEDACNIVPILGSDNPHEHTAGLVQAIIAKAEGSHV